MAPPFSWGSRRLFGPGGRQGGDNPGFPGQTALPGPFSARKPVRESPLSIS